MTVHFLSDYTKQFRLKDNLTIVEYLHILEKEEDRMRFGSDLGQLIVRKDGEKDPIVVSCIKHYFKNPNKPMPKQIHPRRNMVDGPECLQTKSWLLPESNPDLGIIGRCQGCQLACLRRRVKGELESR